MRNVLSLFGKRQREERPREEPGKQEALYERYWRLYERMDALLDDDSESAWREMGKLRKERDRIDSLVVERNLAGKDLEKKGRVEAAIEKYEANVREGTDTPFPYRRLAIIYEREKRYDDALRVLNAQREMILWMQSYWSKRGEKQRARDLEDSLADVRKRVARIKKKMQKTKGST